MATQIATFFEKSNIPFNIEKFEEMLCEIKRLQLEESASEPEEEPKESKPKVKKSKSQKLQAPTTLKELILHEYQKKHVYTLKKILSKHSIALDFSMMGTGKTFTSTSISFDYPAVIVICPGIMLDKWVNMMEYGLPLVQCITYPSLRGASGHQPTHPYLTKNDSDDNDFRVTQEYIDLIRSGVLVIVDEVQNLKNVTTSQFHACMTMIQEIHTSGTSKCLLLSGTPIDKEEQCVALFRLMGVMKRHSELAKPPKPFEPTEWTGLTEIRDCAIKLSSKQIVEQFMTECFSGSSGSKETKKARFNFAYCLFQHVFKPVFKSSMVPDNMPHSLVSYDGHFNIDKKYKPHMMELVESGNIAIYDGGSIVKVITNILKNIETTKMSMFVRIVKEKLTTNKNCKIMLCLNYTSNIEYALEKLSEFSPVVLNGKTPAKTRHAITKKFQEPNLECRVIIGNPKVMSTGIDLDDKHGQFPRFAYISPSYNINELHQVSYRIMRADTKSKATLFYVYVKDVEEINIMAALVSKGNVMSSTTEDQSTIGVKFPGQFEEYFEK